MGLENGDAGSHRTTEAYTSRSLVEEAQASLSQRSLSTSDNQPRSTIGQFIHDHPVEIGTAAALAATGALLVLTRGRINPAVASPFLRFAYRASPVLPILGLAALSGCSSRSETERATIYEIPAEGPVENPDQLRQARQAHDQNAPKFKTKEECEAETGAVAERIQEPANDTRRDGDRNQSSSGTSNPALIYWWRPMMYGYMVGQNDVTPLYRSTTTGAYFTRSGRQVGFHSGIVDVHPQSFASPSTGYGQSAKFAHAEGEGAHGSYGGGHVVPGGAGG